MSKKIIFRNAESAGNFTLVARIMGFLLLIEAAILVIPLGVCLLYGEKDWFAFLIAVGTSLLGSGILICSTHKCRSTVLYRREGYLLTSIAWVIFSLFGMLPFILCEHPLSVSGAFFETMSGFTTTGATVISDVDAMSHGILLWRACTQWVGGLGIVLFMLAILPSLNKEKSLPIFYAETTGITHDKIHPRIRQTAASLWKVYLILTVALILLLWAGPMDLFDAVCHALSTLSTGGFSTRNAGIMAWESDYTGWVMTVFMFVSGINFILIYNTMRGHWRDIIQNGVFKAYLLLLLLFFIATFAAATLSGEGETLTQRILQSAFTVTSAMTSTGFSYGDYELWGAAMFVLLIVAMIIEACAGSTTGGMKVDRILVMWKSMMSQCRRTLYPHHLEPVRFFGKPVENDMLTRIAAFAFLYFILIGIGTVSLTVYGITPSDALFATVSCIGNCGLGYGYTGSGGGFWLIPEPTKWVMSALMLMGRLEIFTVMALFVHGFWRK